MSDSPTKQEFSGWAVLELMGHRRLAGHVEQVELFGVAMIRLDVPGDQPCTQFYSPAALYALTPTTREIAEGLAKSLRPRPVLAFELPAPGRTPPTDQDDDDDADDDDSRDLEF